MTALRPALSDWQPSANREPIVRVGIILEADTTASVRLGLPDEPHELCPISGAARRLQAAELKATLEGRKVGITTPDGTTSADGWRISPTRPEPIRRNSGILVRHVPAGRGFHWQKRIDQTLPGALELRPGRRGLVLVNELPIEDYLAGVITAEMGAHCPPPLLAAQCIVARSWILAFTEPKHRDTPFDRCNDDCCQRYQGTGELLPAAIEAVESTRGLALLDADGRVVDANYSKCCGGISETPEHVWQVSKPGLSAIVDAPAEDPVHRFMPVTAANLDEYLDGSWLNETRVYCSPNTAPPADFGKYLGRVDEQADYFRWTVEYTRTELENVLRAKLPSATDLAVLHDLVVTRRGVSGRATALRIDLEDTAGRRRSIQLKSEYRIREVLHSSFLFSSAFAVRIHRGGGLPERVSLRGAGWGHGAGMCQIGALGMALEGIPYDRIVAHYFPAAGLKQVYR